MFPALASKNYEVIKYQIFQVEIKIKLLAV